MHIFLRGIGVPAVRHRLLVGASVLAVCLLAAHLCVRGSEGSTPWDLFFSSGVYNAIPLLAGAACVARPARSRDERRGWVLIGIGIIAWGLGGVYFTVVFWSTPVAEVPFPSVADGLYLAFYPPVLVGLGFLVRAQLVHFARSLWLDAAIATFTMASIASALVLGVVADATSGSAAVVATNLAYPVGDILLLGLVMGFAALARRRLTRSWWLIAGGLALFALTDSVYLVRVSAGTYSYGIIDLGWLMALALIAVASSKGTRTLSQADTGEEAFVPAIPVTLAGINIGVMMWDHYGPLNESALWLSGLALVGVVLRMMLSMRDNRVMLRESRAEAVTDPLTGLNNRRKFQLDLAEAVEGSDKASRTVLLLFDLDGFKGYNDRFGHPAGDALLGRLARKLSRVAEDAQGRAYRLGGDEFCLLAAVSQDPLSADVQRMSLEQRATAALSEVGEGFSIGSSFGAVVVPEETLDPVEALHLADTRMYKLKNSRPSAGRQSMDVLVSALAERDPGLMDHTDNVTILAEAVAQSFGLPAEEIEEIRLAAMLHDIGKIAIPDSILSKAGPLDDAETEFIRRHTVVGQRITSAAPSLLGVGEIVRWSHERWDGHGYPDGLAGADIPLAARIVFACDAFDAMTGHRSYQAAVPVADALAELRLNAGIQFDRRVVDQLIKCVNEGIRERLRPVRSAV